jgi:hypothetical protein
MALFNQSNTNIITQQHRTLYYKMYILNYKMQVVDEISNVVTDATFSIDATSDIRRTATINITPNNDEWFKFEYGSKIWADKYVKICVGIQDDRDGHVEYTNMGIYLVNNPQQRYSADDKTINIQLVDLMAKMTGIRNGYLKDGVDYQIPKGSNIRDAMIAVLAECGFDRYIINIGNDSYQTTQNDITVSATSTYYEILSQLNEFNVNYEMYFDVDGIFHYDKIPDGYDNLPTVIDNSIWDCVYISHDLTNNYEEVKNKIIVLGKTHTVSYYSTETTLTDNVYHLTMADMTQLDDGIVIGFTPTQVPTEGTAFKIQINSLSVNDVVDDMGQIPNLKVNTYYVAYWDASKSMWIFEGEVTPRGVASEDNPNNPYYIHGTLGEIPITLQGGEYDNISSDNLAKQRAEWELYTRCKLQNNLTMTCIPIYWLDVNWIVSIKFPNETQASLYIIKQISTDGTFDATQQITLMKFYPFYNYSNSNL